MRLYLSVLLILFSLCARGQIASTTAFGVVKVDGVTVGITQAGSLSAVSPVLVIDTVYFTRAKIGIDSLLSFNAAKELLRIRQGSYSSPILALSSAYTLSAAQDNDVITGNTTSAAFSVTLPSAAASGVPGREYLIKRISASANNLTVATTSSQTIDGAASYVLSAQNKYVRVKSDGVGWIIIANN